MEETKETRKRIRANGEGSYRKKANGDWTCTITAGKDPVNGKQVRKKFTARTKQLVGDMVKEYRGKMEGVVLAKDIKFAEWIAFYLDTYAKIKIKETSLNHYKAVLKRYVIDSNIDKQLLELTADDLQFFIGNLAKKGLKPSTIKNTFLIISSSLRQAVKNKTINTNPYDNVILPKQVKRETTIYTQEQVYAFKEKAKKKYYYIAFMLLFQTGMRMGELSALRWSDVDFQNQIIDINKQCCFSKNDDGTRFTDTNSTLKTKNSYRQITFNAELKQILIDHKAKQEQIRKEKGHEWNKNGFVICTHPGENIYNKGISRSFHRLQKSLGMEQIRVHDTRHSFATKLATSNVDVATLALALGDTATTVLNTYVHPDLNNVRKAIQQAGF